MREEDQGDYAMALLLAAGGTLLGYFVPIVGAVLALCLVLLIIAVLVGDAGGAMADLILRPLVALWRWLAQKDAQRLVRWAPVIGIVFGGLLRWAVGGLAMSGGG
jgi:hypothetical protein